MSDLVAQLTAASGLASALIWQALLVLMRIGSAMSLLPAFGERSVPQRVRIVLAGAFTLVVLPAMSPDQFPPAPALAPLLAEVVLGLLIGISLRLFILALQTAGAIAAQATSLSQMFGDAGPEPQPALSNLLIMAALALAVASGLHVRLAQFLILSYQVFPLGQLPAASDVASWGLAQVAQGFALAFSLAAPFTIAALLYNLTLGFINRAMPALMVSFIGAPALTLGGLVLMALAFPLGLAIWLGAFQAFLANPTVLTP
jgi:flagellar biosynthesis protein FliR